MSVQPTIGLPVMVGASTRVNSDTTGVGTAEVGSLVRVVVAYPGRAPVTATVITAPSSSARTTYAVEVCPVTGTPSTSQA